MVPAASQGATVNPAETALWWARARAAGPQRIPPGGPTPSGMLRLIEPDGSGAWLLPVLPDNASAAVLDELGLPSHVLEHPNDTARVLAACVRCCWGDPAGPLWPGVGVPWEQVASAFMGIVNREEAVSHRALLAGVRRLARSGWLLWDEGARMIRLGPRVAAWNAAQLSTLREMYRSMSFPGGYASEVSGPSA